MHVLHMSRVTIITFSEWHCDLRRKIGITLLGKDKLDVLITITSSTQGFANGFVEYPRSYQVFIITY